MNKFDKRLLAIVAIFVLVYSVLVFLIPFAHTPVFWTVYACTCLSVVIVIVGYRLALKRGRDTMSRLLGWPILKSAMIALLVQAVISLCMMAFAGICPAWIAVIVELLILASTLSAMIVRDTQRAAVEAAEEFHANTGAMKALRRQAAALVSMTENAALKSRLQKLADDLKYSDPVSSEATRAEEARIAQLLDDLAGALQTGAADAALARIQDAATALTLRNSRIKSGK